MNRSSFALLIALLIHFLLLLLFWILGTLSPEIKKTKPKEQKIKITLRELPKKYKKSELSKETPKPKKIAPPIPKAKQFKKILKQKKLIKKTELKRKPLLSQKTFIPLIEKKEQNLTQKPKKQDPLAWMFEDKSSKEKKVIKKDNPAVSNISNNIKELYGEEFGKLTPKQQHYIIKNQDIMRRITQQVFTRVASINLPLDLNVNRNNIIEFYLHPNGDMTDFKFLKKSGYDILDATTKETIEYAYSRYPRPKEKTLIRYNFYYHLAKY